MVLFKVQASLVLSFEPLVNISHGRDNKKQERLSSPCLHTGSSRWIKAATEKRKRKLESESRQGDAVPAISAAPGNLVEPIQPKPV